MAKMEKTGVLLPDNIPHPEKIGSKKTETQDIDGRPITLDDAAEIMAATQAAGEFPGKGSVASRVQAAAAVNVQKGIVPPEKQDTSGVNLGIAEMEAVKKKNAKQDIDPYSVYDGGKVGL
eukprot:TRINITY_DN10535_c0_g1_i1.p2 TRINITY_DN10535_c0_g1~~TRINITY_DN10535_c0_g1_i1.p2  ORF type:complete len:120 (-),score=27.06 TRINITY_DN10535_c0_g1_i1:567-926(-)